MTQETKLMYERIKSLMTAGLDDEGRDAVERELNGFIGDLLKEGQTIGEARKMAMPDKEQPAEEEVSQSRLLMEIILEIDTAMAMVPPRVKKYRDLLAAEGLDRTSETPGENGQKGLAGINLADQAALEFHRAMLGLSFSIAQAEVQERLNKTDADR